MACCTTNIRLRLHECLPWPSGWGLYCFLKKHQQNNKTPMRANERAEISNNSLFGLEADLYIYTEVSTLLRALPRHNLPLRSFC